MATAATLTSSIGGQGGAVIPPYYSSFMRSNLYPNLYFRQLGTLVTIPKGSGDKVKIPRWDSPIIEATAKGYTTLDGALTAVNQNVSEGTTITPKSFAAEFISGSVIQFAGSRSYSDKLIIVTRANFLEGALESLVKELAFRLDRYTRKNITASGVQRRAGTGVLAKTTDGLFGKNIAKIGPYMDAANVPRFDDGCLVGVANPLVQYDMYRDPSAQGFVSTRRYNDAVAVYRGEVGEAFGIRWLLSSAIPLRRGGTNFHGLSAKNTGADAIIFAPDAFYSLELETGGVEVIHHPPGSSGSVSDPANQIGSVAVKVWYGQATAPQADNRLMIFSHGIGLHY